MGDRICGKGRIDQADVEKMIIFGRCLHRLRFTNRRLSATIISGLQMKRGRKVPAPDINRREV